MLTTLFERKSQLSLARRRRFLSATLLSSTHRPSKSIKFFSSMTNQTLIIFYINIKIQNKLAKSCLLSLNHPKRQVSQVPKVVNKKIKKKIRVYPSLPPILPEFIRFYPSLTELTRVKLVKHSDFTRNRVYLRVDTILVPKNVNSVNSTS